MPPTPRTVTTHRVFLASPGDVQPERDAVKAVVERINNTVAPAHGKHLDLWRWEERAIPGLHPDGPQKLINPELDTADIVVVILWNRFGRGTAEEAALAIQRWRTTGHPRVMPYFSRRSSLLDTPAACDQRKKVLKFRAGIPGLYAEYTTLDDFERLIYDHLVQVLPTL